MIVLAGSQQAFSFIAGIVPKEILSAQRHSRTLQLTLKSFGPGQYKQGSRKVQPVKSGLHPNLNFCIQLQCVAEIR